MVQFEAYRAIRGVRQQRPNWPSVGRPTSPLNSVTNLRELEASRQRPAVGTGAFLPLALGEPPLDTTQVACRSWAGGRGPGCRAQSGRSRRVCHDAQSGDLLTWTSSNVPEACGCVGHVGSTLGGPHICVAGASPSCVKATAGISKSDSCRFPRAVAYAEHHRRGRGPRGDKCTARISCRQDASCAPDPRNRVWERACMTASLSVSMTQSTPLPLSDGVQRPPGVTSRRGFSAVGNPQL